MVVEKPRVEDAAVAFDRRALGACRCSRWAPPEGPGGTFDALVAFGRVFVTLKPQTVRSKGAGIAVAKDVAIPCPVECSGLRDDAGTTSRTPGELFIFGWTDRFSNQRLRR